MFKVIFSLVTVDKVFTCVVMARSPKSARIEAANLAWESLDRYKKANGGKKGIGASVIRKEVATFKNGKKIV